MIALTGAFCTFCFFCRDTRAMLFISVVRKVLYSGWDTLSSTGLSFGSFPTCTLLMRIFGLYEVRDLLCFTGRPWHCMKYAGRVLKLPLGLISTVRMEVVEWIPGQLLKRASSTDPAALLGLLRQFDGIRYVSGLCFPFGGWRISAQSAKWGHRCSTINDVF